MAGCILRGCGGNNQGLRLRILQDQAKGHDGPIQGNFVLLDVGNCKHSIALEPLLHRVINAQEVLQVIRRLHRACVNVTNANILALEHA